MMTTVVDPAGPKAVPVAREGPAVRAGKRAVQGVDGAAGKPGDDGAQAAEQGAGFPALLQQVLQTGKGEKGGGECGRELWLPFAVEPPQGVQQVQRCLQGSEIPRRQRLRQAHGRVELSRHPARKLASQVSFPDEEITADAQPAVGAQGSHTAGEAPAPARQPEQRQPQPGGALHEPGGELLLELLSAGLHQRPRPWEKVPATSVMDQQARTEELWRTQAIEPRDGPSRQLPTQVALPAGPGIRDPCLRQGAERSLPGPGIAGLGPEGGAYQEEAHVGSPARAWAQDTQTLRITWERWSAPRKMCRWPLPR